MDFSTDRITEEYASSLNGQNLDAIANILSKDVTLSGIHTAGGRTSVLKQLLKVFKWCSPIELDVKIQEKGKTDKQAVVKWGNKGVELTDTITIVDSNKVENIHRQVLDTKSSGSGAAATAIQQLLSLGISFSDTTSTSVLNSPRKKLDAGSHVKKPVLDFSFKEISHPKQLLSMEPRNGIRYKPSQIRKTVVRTTAEVKSEPDPFLHKEEETIVIRVKTKDQEAAYTWDRSDANNLIDDPVKTEELSLTQTSSGKGPVQKFNTNSVKLSNNQLQDVSLLPKCLRLLLHHSMLNLSWIDLSCNNIDSIPSDFDDFPLQVLYLHSNNISSFEEVKKLAGITTLHSLTLWNNPLENKAGGNYKMHCLNILCSRFTGRTSLRKLDHVVISKADSQNCKMFREFTVIASENNKMRSRAVL